MPGIPRSNRWSGSPAVFADGLPAYAWVQISGTGEEGAGGLKTEHPEMVKTKPLS